MSTVSQILIADDEETFLTSTADLLRREGYECACAHDARSAKQMLRSGAYDVLIADINMPGNAQLEFIRELPRIKEGMLVILVTGHPSLHSAIEAVRLPVAAYLVKPCHFGDVLSAVRSALRRRQEEEERLRLRYQVALSDTRLHKLLESAPDAIISVDSLGLISLVNEATLELFGYTEKELLGQPVEILVPDSLRHMHRGLRMAYVAHPRKRPMGTSLNIHGRHKDGRSIPVDIALSHVVTDKGITVTAIIRDITERRRAEQALRDSEERFRALYNNNPSMYFTLDPDSTIRSVNEYGALQLGYSPRELIGRKASEMLVAEVDREEFLDHLGRCIGAPSEVYTWEIEKLRKDGAGLWLREIGRAATGENDQVCIFLVCEDITEARELSRQVSYQATHDPLTELFNRREFERRLAHAIARNGEDGSQHAVCYLDLDQFKVINDTCGHLAGDELLRQLAEVLREHTRKHDTVARLGGDEFAILLEHCSPAEARSVADAVRRAVSNHVFVWESNRFTLGVSIGMVPITVATRNVTEVLSAADAACYMAKDEGRNRIHLYCKDDEEMLRRHGEMQWVARINQALEENRFRLYMQSIKPLTAGIDCGAHYELLLRLQDGSQSPLPPGAFLSAAERFNLITKLDQWVIGTAFRWLAEHPREIEKLGLCSINLSGNSIGNEEFLAYVIREINDSAIPPGKICFEITETAAISNLTRAQSFIAALKSLGCLFALDDFGSGLCSFAYLKNLDVDFLKIDGVFVTDLCVDPVSLAMVRSINEIGHVMGKRTIAEFVEHPEVLHKLREMGVDYAQGFAIDRPRPLACLIQPHAVP